MLLAALHKMFGRERGWKNSALKHLGVSRPTLDRYIRLEESGNLQKIPIEILELLGIATFSQVRATPYEMVNLFALGLVEIQQQLDRFGHIHAPYPEALQRAFHIASAFNIERESDYPTSLARLISVSKQPIYLWCPDYMDGEHGEFYGESCLLNSGTITTDCSTIAALVGKDAEVEFYSFLMNICKELGDRGADYYSAWRKVVIENPVAESHTDLLTKSTPILLTYASSTKELINKFYDLLPAWYAEDGKIPCCPTTQAQLRKTRAGYSTEFRDPLATKALAEKGPVWREYTPSFLELKRPLRFFWCYPGYHELALGNQLKELGWDVEMWPDYDAVDLLVQKKWHGERFAIDVKDYISPISLARNFKGFQRYPNHKKLILVPDYLYKQMPHYREIFNRARKSALAESVQLMSFSDFIVKLEGK